jgi:hypothetical protein
LSATTALSDKRTILPSSGTTFSRETLPPFRATALHAVTVESYKETNPPSTETALPIYEEISSSYRKTVSFTVTRLKASAHHAKQPTIHGSRLNLCETDSVGLETVPLAKESSLFVETASIYKNRSVF